MFVWKLFKSACQVLNKRIIEQLNLEMKEKYVTRMLSCVVHFAFVGLVTNKLFPLYLLETTCLPQAGSNKG
jgi:hypothetical protein